MKPYLNTPGTLAALAAIPLFLGAFATSASAQTKLLDWSHQWNYMHPTGGVLPAGSGATEPNSGATKWYADQTTFAASYTGPSFTTPGAGYAAGLGAGPIGYGALDYFTTPNPAPGEFSALATTLTTPASGSRYTGYFRTTFTVPNDGNFYVNPVIRYIMDDGGFIYLDGVPIVRVNMAATAVDNYTTLAANTTNTESHVREAALSLSNGSTTGGNANTTPVLAGNAVILSRVTSLAPGVHTLAISAHNQANSSSDLDLAVQLVATPTTASIAGGASAVTRTAGTLPLDPADDVVSFKVNVTGIGAIGAGWTITSPAALSGVTGSYGTDVTVNASIADFPLDTTTAPTAPSPLAITIADAATPAVTTAINVYPPRIIASDDHDGQNVPIPTAGSVPNSGWVFDDTARNMTMNNGGGGARKVVNSQVIDLSSIGAVQFSGVLEVVDSSSGFEAADSFVAYLIINGNTASPINLITAYDVVTPADGVLSGAELSPATPGDPPTTGAGTFLHNLSYVIPASANSVQIVIEGTNDSPNEKMIVRDLKLTAAPAGISTNVGAVTVNNQGTDDFSDDTFSAPVGIEAINLGASTGWNSNVAPASGLYADPQPVVFGPYSLAAGPKPVTLTDALNPAVSTSFTLTPGAQAITVGAVTNVVRHENGPGLADDTVTFDTTINGANAGPRWNTATPGVTPTSGAFGTVTFTIAAPLPASPFTVVVGDVSYPAVAQNITVTIPGRYVIGQTNTPGTLRDLATPITPTAPAEYINDAAARTLEVNNAGTPEKVLESEVLDLTSVGAVQFTAKLHATDSSAGSNFETADKVKAELVYEVGGVPTTVNLVTAWDVGNGDPSTTGTGLNGAPDGYINGYQGAAGTDVVNATVYAAALDDYDANRSRDEFNKNLQGGAENLDATFDLSATIPANADNVKLKLYVVGLGAATPTERVFFTDILFSTTAAPVDTDGDGMTDDYEDANGLDKNSSADKLTDLDGDGQSNYAEFLAGTAANNAASTLRITTIVPSGTPNVYNVTIATVAGKRYQLQESTDLGNADTWADVPGGAITATGATLTVPVDISLLGARHYLRAKVVP